MFASLSVAAKIALRELAPTALIAARVSTAALLLWAAWFLARGASAIADVRALVARPREPMAARDLPALAVYALFGIVANQLLFIEGLARSTATNAVVIGASIPVFTVGVAVALNRERATARKLAGLAVALAGALGIVGADRFDAGRIVGNLLIVANSLSFAIYLVISRTLLARYRTLTVVAWTFLFGALGVLPFGGAPLVASAGSLHARTWLALAYIVALPTIGTYFLNAYALKRAPASLVAVYIYVQPVVGALLAAAILGERPSPATAAGAALIAVGIWLVGRSG
jgi:drug/metabolite transporter (DMT)-like permease